MRGEVSVLVLDPQVALVQAPPQPQRLAAGRGR
jgi:hypothetical protein